MPSTLETLARQHGLPYDAHMREIFLQWAEEQCAQGFLDHLKATAQRMATLVQALPNPFPNARKGTAYAVEFSLPSEITDAQFWGFEGTGLELARSDEKATSFTVSGTPQVEGDHDIYFEGHYAGWIDGMPALTRVFRCTITPDPRDLWKEKPVPADIEYPKRDTDTDYVRVESGPDGVPRKDMVAASCRGRSHAHEGKPRDDDFLIRHCADSDWYILAVADGAGSAEFSREGSRIACSVAVETCENYLNNPEVAFEARITSFIKAFCEKNLTSDDCRSKCRDIAYNLISKAAYDTHTAIFEAAKRRQRQIKSYATTLLLVVCKRIQGIWIIISFNIGDGAIGYIRNTSAVCTAKLICQPDEGEYGGQTRFVTMRDIFMDIDALKERVQIAFVQDLTAVLLMTDGVSDAKFETSANLHAPQKWLELWDDLQSNVHFADDNHDCKNELLEWLNFWSPGNHDDRTIAILY